VFWISQNYHDLHDSFMGPVDMAAFNKAVFDSLNPGGVYVVLANPADPRTAAVFDKSIRGHTDQFLYKFKKVHK
jgi:predicted methyltransferase